MAEKISTLILKVDLGCCPCYKKIRKILCKLQDEERIRTISYDDGKHTIAVAGPFDPHKLSCKIRCKGGKLIKGIDILQHNGSADGEPPAINNDKNKHKGNTKEPIHEPPPPPPVEDKSPPHAQPAPPDSHTSPSPVMPVGTQEKKPVELELPFGSLSSAPAEPVVEQVRPATPVVVKPPTVEVEISSWPAPPQPMGHCGCSCCRPCYQGYYQACRCCSCGRVYGYAVSVMPTPANSSAAAGCYAAGFLSEEDPTSACTLM